MKFHSVSDIITNSSQEYYTIQTDLNKEELQALINDIFDIISEHGNPFYVLEEDGSFTLDSFGYYWGFNGCPADDEEQERFEAVLTVCPYIKEWENFQRG